ncbi:DUF433 domain-containing protein [Nitrosomonas sp.]|uniref:DUF433 domain-containing protein n=1 Tax=Nitrosomonas sp. TaxID=42353 RepID=UPI00272FD955|nr:DUF433 domain-containing protein [Nitrosomonas sp.]MDP2223551.1 DUF433 domain-containing protein [Nitrosomonas sp.]
MAGINNQQRWKGRIVTNPEILAGKPVVAGTRISVELILDHLAANWSMTEIIESYPSITPEDILAALAFAADVIRIKPFITVNEIKK